jgi:hypothetical protein
MTVKELKYKLNEWDDNMEVAIAYPDGIGGVVMTDINMIAVGPDDNTVVLEFNERHQGI